jgi:hypothetical protein
VQLGKAQLNMTARNPLNIVGRGDKYVDFPESGWDKIMSLNVKSMFYSKLKDP